MEMMSAFYKRSISFVVTFFKFARFVCLMLDVPKRFIGFRRKIEDGSSVLVEEHSEKGVFIQIVSRVSRNHFENGKMIPAITEEFVRKGVRRRIRLAISPEIAFVLRDLLIEVCDNHQKRKDFEEGENQFLLPFVALSHEKS